MKVISQGLSAGMQDNPVYINDDIENVNGNIDDNNDIQRNDVEDDDNANDDNDDEQRDDNEDDDKDDIHNKCNTNMNYLNI